MSFRKSVDVLSCAVSAHNKLFIVNAKNYWGFFLLQTCLQDVENTILPCAGLHTSRLVVENQMF